MVPPWDQAPFSLRVDRALPGSRTDGLVGWRNEYSCRIIYRRWVVFLICVAVPSRSGGGLPLDAVLSFCAWSSPPVLRFLLYSLS